MNQTNRRIARWVTAVIVSQMCAFAQQSARGQSAESNRDTAATLAYVTADSAMAVIAHHHRRRPCQSRFDCPDVDPPAGADAR